MQPATQAWLFAAGRLLATVLVGLGAGWLFGNPWGGLACALALHLANLGAGRKTMLLVSEQADPMLRRRGLESLPTSSSVMRTANRANVAIYVLDRPA